MSTSGGPTLIARQFVLKAYSRCNLACDYCYVYELGDTTWRDQPYVMSLDVVRLAADRIAEHVATHDTPNVGIVLHGGEPLLAGPAFFKAAASVFRQALPKTGQTLTVQTNGVLLSRPFLELFAEHQINVAVSVDGDEAAHNRHRKYANGRGSYAEVARGLELLNDGAYRSLFRGLLCTVDLAQDPVDCYESLLRFNPPRMDFLLPLGNWTARPPGRPDDDSTPYADWLSAVFDRWYGASTQETELRLFGEIIHLLLGGQSQLESIGPTTAPVVVVETDGSLEQVDALKSAYHGAAATGLRLARNSINDLLAHPAVVARHNEPPAAECQRCPVRDICGGGYYPHRYRAGSFTNPSVYCPDLYALIHHIRARVAADIHRLAEVAR